MTSNRIASFLRREFAPHKAKAKGGAIVSIECRHFPVNSKRGEEVWSTEIEGEVTPEWIVKAADEIAAICDDDAENMHSGPQRYALFLYREQKPDRALRGVVFMVDGPEEADEDGERLETEPPTKTGLTALAMRHLEATQRMHVGAMAAVMGAMQKMLTTTTAENEKLREQRIESLSAIEEVFSQRHQRELETEQSRARTAMLQEGVKKLTAIAPMALAHIAGKTNPAAGMAIKIQSVLGNLSDEQKGKLFELLSSEDFQASDTQKLALGDLLSSINGDSEAGH